MLNLQVTPELSVNLLPNSAHEFLMTTKEVANGYGVSEYAIRKNKFSLGDELVEGKHFIIAVTIGNVALNLPHNAVLWTKRGVIRMGFAMRSPRAKLFRDWAEELIINVMENPENFLRPVPVLAAPKKRNHNRLTQERMISILADVAKVEDRDLRLSLIEKLGV